MAKMDSGQLKMAEKLVILNDRSLGMLTRIYNVKKACANFESKPRFLKEKSLESAIVHVIKKFPAMDVAKRSGSTFAPVDHLKHDILKNLSLYYYTFSELLDLKDHILQLLTTMDANQCQLDITLNYDLTAGFLNLMSNFVALMLLLSRVEDRKAIVGLYNIAYDMTNSRSEPSYPRLGQMILDYENPLRRLSEDFSSVHRLVQSSLASLHDVYFRRNISADQLRQAGMMSLTSSPNQMLYAAQTDTVACEYLSLETMDRWIIFGMTVCHSTLLNDNSLMQMLRKSLEHTLSLRLFRDEPLLIFPMLIAFFEGVKGAPKRLLQELKQLSADALESCAIFHAHRRQFIRTALKEICALIRDQPGLLGPKTLFVWMGLSLARDEVLWLLRHADLVNVNKKLRAALENVVTDRSLPELLFHMCELRDLVTENAPIVSNYYREFIYGYDAIALREIIEGAADGHSLFAGLADGEAVLIKSFADAVAKIKTHDVNLCGLRLDWYRFQANVSVRRSIFQLRDHRKFAAAMNTAVFHTKMIDILPEMLKETSDLSIYAYYPDQFDGHCEAALKFPPQARYSIAFAQLTEHFAHSTHDMCPEERDHIVERGILSCNAVLEKIAAYISMAFEEFTREEQQLTEATSPKSCAEMIYINYQMQGQPQGKNAPPPREPQPLPGHESVRLTRIPPPPSKNANPAALPPSTGAEFNNLERRNLYFAELLQSVAHTSQLCISDHIFMPKAFLAPKLEFAIMKSLVAFARPDRNAPPRRPSELYSHLQCLLVTLQRVDDCVGIDLARLFNDALLQQSQALDSYGQITLTSIYSEFYSDLLHRSSLGQFMYSDHLKTFVTNPDASSANTPAGYSPELYTDVRELRALAQIISPYGVKIIAERLISMCAGQIVELFKLVRQRQQRELLREARISYDKPDRMRELVSVLMDSTLTVEPKQNGNASVGKKSGNTLANGNSSNSPTNGSSSAVESILQRISIIGGIAAFRQILYAAVNDTLKQRMPFLLASLNDLHSTVSAEARLVLSETLAAAGIESHVDQGLVNVLRMKWGLPATDDPLPPTAEINEHYELSCLVMVFIAIALPQLAATPKATAFKASLIATQNNCHTIAWAVDLIGSALFHIHGREDITDRMREFLALASSGLLHNPPVNAEPDSIRAHQSLYILLEQLVKYSPWLNYSLLESCFPYTLIRSAYSGSYRADVDATMVSSALSTAR